MVKCSAVTVLKSLVQMRAPTSFCTGTWTLAVLTSRAKPDLVWGTPSCPAHQGHGTQSGGHRRAAWPRVYDKGFCSVWKVHKKQPDVW